MNFRRHLLLICVLVFAACEPYEFTMSRDQPIDGLILTPLETVAPGTLVTTVHDGGAIKLSNFGITEYSLTFGLNLKAGTGVEVLIHPRVEVNRVVDSGIVASITSKGESLIDNGRVLANRPDFSLDSKLEAVNIISEAHFLQVLVGCDTLYRGPSDRIESDDIVVRSLPGSDVEVVAPAWRYVPDLVR